MKYVLFPLLAAIAFGPADTKAGSPAAKTAEIVTFHLNAGVSEAEFLAAAAKTTSVLRQSGQVLSRSLSRDDAGLWTDYIVWTSREMAEKTAAVAMEHPDFAPFMAMISPVNMEMRHASIAYQMD